MVFKTHKEKRKPVKMISCRTHPQKLRKLFEIFSKIQNDTVYVKQDQKVIRRGKSEIKKKKDARIIKVEKS